MIFLTVGTQFPFDRLVEAVDCAVATGGLSEDVFAQVGQGGFRPSHMQWCETLKRDAFGECVSRARALIGHAGIGTIFAAIDARRPLLVMPRLSRYGEIVNDHQVSTARKFAEMGHVLMARDETEIPQCLRLLDSFVPRPRTPRPEGVVERVRDFLDEVSVQRQGRAGNKARGRLVRHG